MVTDMGRNEISSVRIIPNNVPTMCTVEYSMKAVI